MTIMVMGGAGGVGSAVVDMLVARGDKVVATVLNAKERKHVTNRHGDAVPTHELDLTNAEEVLARLREVINGMEGDLTAIVVCAAISPYGPVETTPLAVFQSTFQINCLAQVAVYQAALPALRDSKGRIVFISSMAGRAAMPFIGAYVASKYALEGVADVMRREAAPQGVKISLIEPGGIRTGMVEEQLRTIKTRIAALTDEEESRYGDLYRQFQTLATQSQETTASTAEQVAEIILQALDAIEPETRYIAGDDGKEMIEMARTLSDRELDAAFVGMFSAG